MTQTNAEAIVEAHEWECKKCHYFLRLEMAPLHCDGAVCDKCHQAVEYHGIKNVLRSQLGVTDAE